MATAAQKVANRRNAQKSTGPRSPEGKTRSAQNSLKHGLTAADVVLALEDRADFEEFRATLIAEHQPANTTELLLVSQIATAQHRMREIARLETAAFERGLTDQESATYAMSKLAVLAADPIFTLLRRYDAAATSLFHRALTQLTKLQNQRRREERQSATPVRSPRVIQITPPVTSTSNTASAGIGFVSQSALPAPRNQKPEPRKPNPARARAMSK